MTSSTCPICNDQVLMGDQSFGSYFDYAKKKEKLFMEHIHTHDR